MFNPLHRCHSRHPGPFCTHILAYNPRRRLRELPQNSDPAEVRRRRTVIEAWLAAVQEGDFAALLSLLDEGAVLHADYGAATETIQGGRGIADRAVFASRLAAHSHLVWIGGRAGVAAVVKDSAVSLMAFTIADGRITRLDVLADPARLSSLDITAQIIH